MILPNCCTKRPDCEEVKKECVTLPEVDLMDCESLMDDLEIKGKGKGNEDGSDMNMKSQSRRSTNFTNFSYSLTGKKEGKLGGGNEGLRDLKRKESPNELYCGTCGQAAEGYCPACPFRRFCKLCFDCEHGEKMRIHQFVTYEKKRKVGNLSKMKMLFK